MGLSQTLQQLFLERGRRRQQLHRGRGKVGVINDSNEVTTCPSTDSINLRGCLKVGIDIAYWKRPTESIEAHWRRRLLRGREISHDRKREEIYVKT